MSVQKSVANFLAAQKKLEASAKKTKVELAAKIKEAKQPIKVNVMLVGLVKSYMDTVKNSSGLTSAKPSCVKAVQAAEKAPSPASVKKAVDAMTAHVAELEAKEKANKDFVMFKKNMEKVIQSTKALIS